MKLFLTLLCFAVGAAMIWSAGYVYGIATKLQPCAVETDTSTKPGVTPSVGD